VRFLDGWRVKEVSTNAGLKVKNPTMKSAEKRDLGQGFEIRNFTFGQEQNAETHRQIFKFRVTKASERSKDTRNSRTEVSVCQKVSSVYTCLLE
jgi:hypothetical protein